MKLRSILAATAALLASCAVHAGVTGQVTIGQFSYTLTDINPNDGIAPSITFLPTPSTGPSAEPGVLLFSYSAGNAGASHYVEGAGSQPVSVDYTETGLTVGGSLSGTGVLDTASLSLHASTDPSFGQDVSAYATMQARFLDFVLSPHTALTVQAQLHFAGEVTDSGTYNRLKLDGNLWLSGQNADDCCVSQRFGAGSGLLAGPTPAFDRIEAILGTWSNNSASSFQGSLLMYGSLDALSEANGVTVPAPPVPEPAIVAMLGAGLPLLLALRRRALRTGRGART
jgi:hypothetical protein